MRRTKEILRLRFESGLGLRQIARGLLISVGTVHDYLQRAETAGIKWPLPEGFDDDRLEAALFPQPTMLLPPRKTPPDTGHSMLVAKGFFEAAAPRLFMT